MRLWSLHPKYLDSRGLVALWREGLLAQAVLAGRTRGYRNHPQLERFKLSSRPLHAIGAYLSGVWEEANARGYHFDRRKILHVRTRSVKILSVTRGQLKYEWRHLIDKLRARDRAQLKRVQFVRNIEAHPVFRVRPGVIAKWERISAKRD